MADPVTTERKGARDRVADAVAGWRRDLGYAHDRNSAEIARLRRIGLRDDGTMIDTGAAIAVDAWRSLYQRIANLVDTLEPPEGLPWRWESKALRDRANSGFDTHLALAAGVLAHVKTDTGGNLGGKLRDRNYSELRFRRLLRLETDADLLREGRRLVRMLDGDVPVASFARALLFWDARETRALARGYYNAELFRASASPTQNNNIEDVAQ
ncbi:MAG: type I-E CRISPR-associated protein Cse2/CasB [Alphaproteobacteria bacterium]|nr:type I-E CRISPR-associated protein Cse2/CasB [Alphaproteobacteria bacterium]